MVGIVNTAVAQPLSATNTQNQQANNAERQQFAVQQQENGTEELQETQQIGTSVEDVQGAATQTENDAQDFAVASSQQDAERGSIVDIQV